uniref:Small ribosomal subunit protein uS17c n=1 Tax=Bangiopsis subsimplex TaxID=139980 RepID=A0A1C9CD26_9RHOD|nr:ribosomal protein S17 [Bangiopsis subsimplex]AOM66267.1 ribosomal protein S17 [Bangiopsis subsimplex]ARO90371.1 30S ribosomal protein S17 [Bangiopsis subsimplex]
MPKKERVGIVVSNKMHKTLVVAVASRILHPKYKKIMIKTKRYKVHTDQENIYQLGDTIRIQETRPLSKTKRWKVLDTIAKSPR